MVRIFNTYGPRLQANDGRVISNFMMQALRGEPLTIYGDGLQTRSFCFVSDLIDGIVRLGDPPSNARQHRKPEPNSPCSSARRRFSRVTGSKSEIVHKPLAPGRSHPPPSRHHRARTLLGWEPRSLREGP